MAIVVNRNQNAIFGNIDGQKFPNIPLDPQLYEELKGIAKEANAKTNKKDFAKEVTKFKLTIKNYTELKSEGKVIQISENNTKTPVKSEAKVSSATVGKTNYQIKKKEDGHSYLYNGVKYSKFYIPTEILERIQTSESKEIDASPMYKFFIRALRGEKMTQEKLNRISKYISKSWIDTEEQQRLTEKGYSIQEAIKQASGRQVGITQEGILSTYKASNLVRELASVVDAEIVVEPELSSVNDTKEDGSTKTFEEILKEVKANSQLVDFVFVPVRNSKGHFLKRGSDEYIIEYNRQLDSFMAQHGLVGAVTTSINVESQGAWNTKTVDKSQKAVARLKSAEDFIFEPANQGQNGDAFYCGNELGHNIQVGKIHRLPNWSYVSTDDYTSHQKGLHVGGMDYVKGYINNPNSVVHNIFVDPAHIGACLEVEQRDGAMRVLQYFVHSSLSDKPNRGIYNSSNYAAQLDAEWDAQFAAASKTVAELEAQIEALKKEAAAAQEVLDNSFN